MVLTYAGQQTGRSSNVYLRLRATDFGVVMERPITFDAATHGHHVTKYFANFRPDGDLYFYSYPSGGNPYKLSDGSFLQSATILTFKWNVNTDREIDWYREPIAMETLFDPQAGIEALSLCGQSADGETVGGSLWRITYTRYPPPRPFDLWARFQGLHMSALGGAPLTQDPPRDPDRHYKFTVPYGSMLLVSQSTADLAGYRNPERTFYADMGGSFPFIVQINLAGDQLMGFGLAGHADDELWMVNGLTVDGTYIYVADWNYDGGDVPYTPPGDPWYTERHIHALDSVIDSFGWHHRVHDNLVQLIYQRAKSGENFWSPGVAVTPLGSARICPSITAEHDGTLTIVAEDPADDGAVHLYRSHDHGDTWS
jgi:hypothetical protein